jgi:hypothetical protein
LDRIGNVFILVCTLIEIIFQIVLIIYQSQTIALLKTVNPALISYAVDNSCSDGPLQAAFKTINDNISQDMTLVGVGLGFTVASFVALIFFHVTTLIICKKNL